MFNFSLYEIPNDFNEFITKIHNDLNKHIKRKLWYYNIESQSILSSFIIYMLEKNKFGIIRYMGYDGVKYYNISYNKWFVTQLNFFILKNMRKDLYELDREANLCFKEYPFFEISDFGMPDSNVVFREILEFLEKYSNINLDSFGSNVYNFFIYKMEGYKHKELAFIFNVSFSTITIWVKKLQNLINSYINYVGYSNNLIRT